MAKIRPFKAIRPTRDKVHLFATRSYLTYSESTLKEKLENNPYTFLHIINPEYKDKDKKKGIEKYQLIKKKFNNFIESTVLKKEEKQLFYLYRQKTNSHIFEGIIAACCVDDYLDSKIKIHEHTITKREQMFTDYLATTGFNADPVLLAYKGEEKINEVIKQVTKNRPEYNFTTTNKVQHQMWLIEQEDDINLICKQFEKIDKIYIADGHHRSASSALLAERKNAKKNANSNYLIDQKQLNIINFNRLVYNLNGNSSTEFLTKIEKRFNVINKGSTTYSPINKGEISMYFRKNWYSLNLKTPNFRSIVESLDPSILSENILKPILDIQNEKIDKNISFFDGTIPLQEIKEKVDTQEFSVAFILKHISIE